MPTWAHSGNRDEQGLSEHLEGALKTHGSIRFSGGTIKAKIFTIRPFAEKVC